MGKKAFKEGVRLYTDRYKWKSSTGENMFECFQEAWDNQNNNKLENSKYQEAMGSDFDLNQWCEDFVINTNGIDIISPSYSRLPKTIRIY